MSFTSVEEYIGLAFDLSEISNYLKDSKLFITLLRVYIRYKV